MYFDMSFVTIMLPAALTGNFLKWSNNNVRKLMASSVRRYTRLSEGERAVRQRLWKRVKKVNIDRQVFAG